MEPTDEELVDRVIRKQQEGFSLLFERYRATVCSHLNGIVREPATADDLTQEVFLRLWNRADQWNGDGALPAWLLRIATHLALNHLRTVKRRREQPIQPAPVTDTDPADDVIHKAVLHHREVVAWELGIGDVVAVRGRFLDLTDEPAQEIDGVNARAEEGGAWVLGARVPGRARELSALVLERLGGGVEQVAEGALREQALRQDRHGNAPVVLAHHQRTAALLDGAYERVRLIERAHHRLLQEHVPPTL